MGTEALIFTVAALNTGEIKEEHQDFVKKVKGGAPKPVAGGGGSLSSKIDELMKEAKLDVGLMKDLASSIKDLETSAKSLAPASEAIAATKTYGDKLNMASTQLEQLNSAFQSQLQHSQKSNIFNAEMDKNAAQLKQQMDSLGKNLANLNSVYGGMLSAMSSNK